MEPRSNSNLDPNIFLSLTDSDNREFVVMEINKDDLKTIFQRALNTWCDVPPYVLALSDKLEKL